MTVEAGVMDRIELSELIDIEIPCEHSRHQTDTDRHQGNAEWVQSGGLCGCGAVSANALMCDKWRKWVSDLARTDGKLYCVECKTSFPANTMSYTKI